MTAVTAKACLRWLQSQQRHVLVVTTVTPKALLLGNFPLPWLKRIWYGQKNNNTEVDLIHTVYEGSGVTIETTTKKKKCLTSNLVIHCTEAASLLMPAFLMQFATSRLCFKIKMKCFKNHSAGKLACFPAPSVQGWVLQQHGRVWQIEMCYDQQFWSLPPWWLVRNKTNKNSMERCDR